MRRASILLICMFASLQALAQAGQPQTFEEWWSSLRKVQSPGIPLDGYKIRWRVTPLNPIATSQGPQRPDGSPMRVPEIGDAPVGSAAVSDGISPATESTAWGKGDLWRFSRSGAGDAGPFLDQAVGARLSWQWDTDLLSLVPLGADTPRTHDIALGRNDMAVDFGILHAGVLHAPILARVPLQPRLDSSGRWTLEREFKASPGVRFLVRASGTFDAQSGVGTVDASSIQNLTRGQTEPFAWSRASDWRPSWVTGLTIAASVEYADQSAPTHARYELISASPLAEGEIAQVTEAPSLDRADPVRGAFGQGRFEDLRGAEAVISIVKSGRVVAVESGGASTPGIARSATRRVVVASIGFAGILAVAYLIYHRIRSTP